MQSQLFHLQIVILIITIILLHRATIVLRHERNKLLQLNDEIAKDGLTNTYNRYFLNYTLNNINFDLISMSLAIIDVDNFKGINDTHGHAFGDEALRCIGNLLNKYTKKYEGTFPIRIGGDEFIILSYSLDKDCLYEIVTKIVNELNNTEITHEGENDKITLSIGIANSTDSKCESYTQLYEAADSKLYQVKSQGKSSIAK